MRIMAKQLFIAIFVILWKYSSGLSPVILIPGIGGSQLEAKFNKPEVVHSFCDKVQTNYFTIWLNFIETLPYPLPIIDCMVDNLRLVYDNVSRTTKNSPGVDIRVPGWGTTETVDSLDPWHILEYFGIITEALENIGYVRNISLRGAPYDFRKAANEQEIFFAQLKTLVEETYTMNGNSAITLLVHSMGGFMGQYFLKQQTQEWKDHYIKRFIALGTPWGGFFEALQALLTGIDITKLLMIWKKFRTLFRTLPSIAWLLPSADFWEPTEVLVQTPKFNYTINDLEKLFLDRNLPNVWEMRYDTMTLNDLTAPGVELHCLYGTSVPTTEKLIYDQDPWEDDDEPYIDFGNGDGVINYRSLSGCSRFSPADNHGHPITSEAFDWAHHVIMMYDSRVIDYITNILSADID